MSMFCFQCEQTTCAAGCTTTGVCGKGADTAALQDRLTGELIGLARAADGNVPTESTHRAVLEGLFSTVTNVNFNNETLEQRIKTVQAEKAALIPRCGNCASPCGRNDSYDMAQLWQESDQDVRSLKSLLLFGLRGMAAYAHHAMVLGRTDERVNDFFYKCLFAIGEEKGSD